MLTAEEKERREREKEQREQNKKKEAHIKRMDDMKRLMINQVISAGSNLQDMSSSMFASIDAFLQDIYGQCDAKNNGQKSNEDSEADRKRKLEQTRD
jgi:hypothetical protein